MAWEQGGSRARLWRRDEKASSTRGILVAKSLPEMSRAQSSAIVLLAEDSRLTKHLVMNRRGLGDGKLYATVPVVLGYALCSSLLAVINKYAITYFPFPSLLTALQYLTSVVGVVSLGKLGLLQYDSFVWDTAKQFLPAAVVFYLAIFTNTNLLKHANVDTFIVFRSSTPLLVALADTLFRQQPLPSKYTFASLIVILGGAVGYVITDSAFTVTAYSWAAAYLVVITTEMVYIKHMVTNLGLNTWGFVYYNNLLSLLLSPLFAILTGEVSQIRSTSTADHSWMGVQMVTSVALSCLFGLAISFFGFAARKAISATAFTVTGVVNKLLTVVINITIWDKHASSTGVGCLLLTIVGGVLYQQSTMGGAAPPQRKTVDVNDAEVGRLDPAIAETVPLVKDQTLPK